MGSSQMDGREAFAIFGKQLLRGQKLEQFLDTTQRLPLHRPVERALATAVMHIGQGNAPTVKVHHRICVPNIPFTFATM